MLIGQMEVVSGLDDGEPAQVVQPISHTKSVREMFKWDEKQKWEYVANLTINMDLWVGSPSVFVQFTNIHEQRTLVGVDGVPGDPKIFYDRIHPVKVDRTVTISGTGGSSVPHGNYQVFYTNTGKL